MSALGQKQTFAVQNVMSALPPIADMCGATGMSAKCHLRPFALQEIESVSRSKTHVVMWSGCDKALYFKSSDYRMPSATELAVAAGGKTDHRARSSF